MARTSYSVSRITNTSDDSMGLYITDPNKVEHYIDTIPAGATTAQLMPSNGTWAWKPAKAQLDEPILGAASGPSVIKMSNVSRKLGEGNDGGRKFLE